MKQKRIVPYPQLSKRIEEESEFRTRVPYTIEQEDIPQDPHEFYKDFGYLTHSRTGQLVERLTDYQYNIWNCNAKTVLVDKSQKSGITTSELIHDFQESILNGKGKDILIIGQTAKHAEEHLYTLKRLIVESPKYRKYLITKSSELYFREEQTKVRTLFLKNPDNPYRPMRIIGLPFTVTSIWSWKNVFRIHISDPAAAPVVDDASVYAAAFSRLTNTNGRMMIEGPPKGPYGRFYELYEQFKTNENPEFQTFLVTIYDARNNGLVTQEFIDEKKIELGPLFPQTYEGSFEKGAGNLFEPQHISQVIENGEKYSVSKIPVSQTTLKSIGLDTGYSSSGCGIVVCEHIKHEGKHIIRIIDSYLLEKSDPVQVTDLIYKLYAGFGYFNCVIWADTADRGTINLLKSKFGENLNWATTEEFGDDVKVRPVPFNREGRNMLNFLYLMVTKNYLAIENIPKYAKLLTSMRTSFADGWDLDKRRTLFSDLTDGLRLALKAYQLE